MNVHAKLRRSFGCAAALLLERSSSSMLAERGREATAGAAPDSAPAAARRSASTCAGVGKLTYPVAAWLPFGVACAGSRGDRCRSCDIGGRGACALLECACECAPGNSCRWSTTTRLQEGEGRGSRGSRGSGEAWARFSVRPFLAGVSLRLRRWALASSERHKYRTQHTITSIFDQSHHQTLLQFSAAQLTHSARGCLRGCTCAKIAASSERMFEMRLDRPDRTSACLHARRDVLMLRAVASSASLAGGVCFNRFS